MSAPASYDLIVVGAGVNGSAVAYYAARRGAKVLALERARSPHHAEGSSHGATRIYRTTYLEGPQYVPLSQRAQVLWAELAQEAREPLLVPAGCLSIGRPDGAGVRGALESARRHGLRHELLTPSEIAHRYPAFRPSESEVGVLDPQAGVLKAERCLEALQQGAVARGAELACDEPAVSWKEEAGRWVVRTRRREVRTRALVLAGGPWMPGLVPWLTSKLHLERQAVFFFEAPERAAAGMAARMPTFIWEPEPGSYFYGLPDLGEGVKVAHHGGPRVRAPEATDRRTSEEDLRPVRAFVASRLPGADGPVRSSTTCLYTMSPAGSFLIGPLPGSPGVWVVSACSGHGFKFAPAIGEAIAGRALGETRGVDLAPFAPGQGSAGPGLGAPGHP